MGMEEMDVGVKKNCLSHFTAVWGGADIPEGTEAGETSCKFPIIGTRQPRGKSNKKL